MSNMEILAQIIEDAKRHVKGELELDYVDGAWIAMDYREDLGSAFPIETKNFNTKIITAKEAKMHNIDVRKCCDICGVAYVG